MSPVWLAVMPLALAAVAYVDAPRRAAWGMLAALLIAVAALLALLPAAFTAWSLSIGGWAPPLGIRLEVDGLSRAMLLLTAGVGVLVSLHAWADRDLGRGLFWPLWLLLWGGMNALYLSRDLFNIYVTLELVGLAAVALVTLSGKLPALKAAMRYLLVSLLGSLCYLLGVAILYGRYGVLDMGMLALLMEADVASMLALSLMTVGLLAKTALFPLHVWLPPAHGSAPAPVSAVLSALVVKASFYLLLRLWLEMFGTLPLEAAARLLGLLGAAALLWGGLQAMLTPRLKLLVAWSTVAQLGYLFILFALAAGADASLRWMVWGAGLYFLLSHACAKAAMFLAAGNLQRAAGGEDRLDHLSAAQHANPMSLVALGIAGVSLAGLPPTGGFLAKWLMLDAALLTGQWLWAVLILAGGLLTAAYTLRALAGGFSPAPPTPSERSLVTVPQRMQWSALLLALSAVMLGFTGGLILPAVLAGEGQLDAG